MLHSSISYKTGGRGVVLTKVYLFHVHDLLKVNDPGFSVALKAFFDDKNTEDESVVGKRATEKPLTEALI